MQSLRPVFLLLLATAAASASPVLQQKSNLTNYKLLSAKISKHSFGLLQALQDEQKIDLWADFPGVDGDVLFSVAPQSLNEVRAALQLGEINTQVVEEDLQRLINAERAGEISTYSSDRPLNLRQYEPYEQIISSIEHYARTSQGSISKFVVGRSYEGRDIVGIQISNGMSEDKPIVFMECGIHAREWISTSTCLYIINELVSNGNKYSQLLNKYEFRIVPSTNPDGYTFSRNSNRLWRKNRKPFQSMFGSSCYGVDLNRNFKAGPHCGVGTSRSSCQDTYCGPSPFSEPESASVRNYLTGLQGRVSYYISLHAFGLMWMFPYSHTSQHTTDHEELLARATEGANAIRQLTNTEYRVGNIADTIYAVTGSSIDWAYMELGIKNSYILELQPSLDYAAGGRGFILPPSQIIPVGKETLHGLQAMWMTE